MKADKDVIKQQDRVLAPSSSTCQLQTHGSGFKNRRKGNLPQSLRKTAASRHVSGVSPAGGLQRPLHKAAQVKPRWPWRPQDIRDARAMEDLPRRAVRKWDLLMCSFLRKTISPPLCIPYSFLVICLGLGLCSFPVYFDMPIGDILIQLTLRNCT